MKSHPAEASLALLAGGECGPISRFLLNRHVRNCGTCLETVSDFAMLRQDVLTDAAVISESHWKRLEAEMRANIHLGLEAGECVRQELHKEELPRKVWNPRLGVAFACLTLLACAGFVMRAPRAVTAPVEASAGNPVLESTGSGLKLRTGESSLTLLNRQGSVADQTVSAQGVIRASYIDAGGVTINNVYLE